jgi:GNAT superfamily N-acetyltransferase
LKKQKREPDLGSHTHLLMGVSQEFQGKGFGGKMLRALIEKAEAEKNQSTRTIEFTNVANAS